MARDYDPAPLNFSTGALASSIVVPGRICVYRVYAYNSNAGTRYIQFFDANAVPADTAVPLFAYPLLTKTGYEFVWFDQGRQFQTGLVVCNSTTDTTKTLGSADSFFDVQFDVYEEQNAPGTGA